MECDMTVTCISKELCANCPCLDLDIHRNTLSSLEYGAICINEIECANYKKCSNMLRYLTRNIDDALKTTDPIGRNIISRDAPSDATITENDQKGGIL